MARVTGKYDVKFQRGPGAFESLLSQFMGIRTKENKEQYLRQLQAASPKQKYEILRDLIRERRALGKEAMKGVRPSMSGGYTTTTTKVSTLRSEYLEENRKFRKGFETAKKSVADNGKFAIAIDRHVQKAIKLEAEGKPDEAVNNLAAEIAKSYNALSPTYGRTPGALQGMTETTIALARAAARNNPGVLKLVNAAISNLATKMQVLSVADSEDRKKLTNQLTTQQERAVKEATAPTTSTRTPTSRMTSGDRAELSDYYLKQIKKLDDEIADARRDYEQAQAEYKDLLRGPNVNLALAAFAKRPSKTGEIIEGFESIREADPDYARGLLDADVKEFNPYEDLKFLPNAAGKTPINSILNSVRNFESLLGRPTIQDPTVDDESITVRNIGKSVEEQRDINQVVDADFDPNEKLKQDQERVILGSITGMRDVTDDDVLLIQKEAEKLSGLFASSIFDDSNYGTIKFHGQDIDIRKVISSGGEYIANAKNPDQKRRRAQEYVNAIVNFEIGKTPEQIESLTRRDQMGFKISKRINRFLGEEDYFEKTRDSRPMRKAISSLYNDFAVVSPEVRGQIGDEVLNAIEQYERMPSDKRNPSVLAARLRSLGATADEIGSENILIGDPDLFEDLAEGDRQGNPGGRVTGMGAEMEAE